MQTREIFLIRDGAPPFACDVCALQGCAHTATANVLVLDAETQVELVTLALCDEHAKRFATTGG